LRLVFFLLGCAILATFTFSCSSSPDDSSTKPSMAMSTEGSNDPKSADGMFLVCESNGQAGKHKFSLFFPRDYDASKKYPTIVFLHGAGEQSDDGIKCRTVGLGPAIVKRGPSFPFIVIFPQDGDWNSDDSDRIMLDALHEVEKYFSVDKDRITLTGMSTGGKGVWVMGAKHPDIFAALVPVSANKAEDKVDKLKDFPIWAFQNEGDPFVNASETRDMISKLESAGAHPKVTYYKSGDHNSWDQAYNEDELYKWIAEQHRGRSGK
jgi:predicted peptidase